MTSNLRRQVAAVDVTVLFLVAVVVCYFAATCGFDAMNSDYRYSRKRKLDPPNRWMHCPRKSAVIADLFVALKTPLGCIYDSDVPEECRFSPEMALRAAASFKKGIGLWIDLTNTTRFYDKTIIEKAGVDYKKLNCKGFGECPSEQQTDEFIGLCKIFNRKSPDKLIAVHCTHGFNRTGFLIICYLVLEKNFSVEAAVNAFAKARPPGIYKQDYLNELFNRLDGGSDPPVAPALPRWCNEQPEESDDPLSDLQPARKIPSVQFAEGIVGVDFVSDPTEAAYVRRTCRQMCKYSRNDFPGCQPVSLTRENMSMFAEQNYMVSWKADGTRYMMLIDGDRRTFLIGRDNNVFSAPNFTFLQRNSTETRKQTLVDGELVVDQIDGSKVPRYLIYDIVALDGRLVGELPFDERQRIIAKEVIDPRNAAISAGRLRRQHEPFGVRLKPFYELQHVKKVLSLKVAHETDGLVFQPVNEPYTAGRCMSVLKWKPSDLNSVDFRLVIEKERRLGMLAQNVGNLMVANSDRPFDRIKVTKDLLRYNHKIIECAIVNGDWSFLRERTDKLHPNSFETAQGVRESIRFPVTEQSLTDYINSVVVVAVKDGASAASGAQPAGRRPVAT